MNTYWTNLACAASQVCLYHDHGTSEQFHSELKSDLDIEQLPSGKLCVNRIVLLCGMLAFNLLRTIGQEVIVRADLASRKNKGSPLALEDGFAEHRILRRARDPPQQVNQVALQQDLSVVRCY